MITWLKVKNYFGVLSKEQEKIVDKEISLLKKRAEEESSKKNDSSSNYTNRFNGSCPRCYCTTVVDKIANVRGGVEGTFTLGFGSVFGDTSTGSVNECVKCRHQWKKHERQWYGKKDIIVNWLYRIRTHMNKGKTGYNFGDDVYEEIKALNVSLESLEELHTYVKWDYKQEHYSNTWVTTKELRKYFKSVKDYNGKREVQS